MDDKEALSVAECVADGAYKVLDNDPDEVLDRVLAAAKKEMHPLAYAVVEATVAMQRHDREAVRKLQDDGADDVEVSDKATYLGKQTDEEILDQLAHLGE